MIHKYQYGAPVYVPDLKTLKATRKLIGRGTRKVAEYGLRGLGWLGKAINSVITAGASSDFGQTSPFTFSTGQKRKNILKGREQVRLQAKLKIVQGMTWVSPLNYGAALWNGHGLNAEKGAEEISTWDPRWQLLGRVGELYVGPKAVKGVKSAPKTIINTAAKAGVKPAKATVIAREINKGINQNTKNGRIEVTEDYFNSPDKWYRITETPEKYGIIELGKNVTTHDASQTYGTINGWRSSMLRAPITKSSEGFIKRPHKIEINIRRKNGQAHGNTSQAAKGKLWGGTTSGSNLFPEGVIEGLAPSMINYGIDRTNFVITPWELVPKGGRVGFHTGEMPMSNLGWFLKTKNGTYTYEPIIPEKRININPPTKLLRVVSEKTYPWYRGKQHSVNEVVNPDGTVNPRLAMRIQHEVSLQFPGSYKMEHRLENPEWHQNDPTTYHHTKNVALSAWGLDTPYGFTKHDLMVAALGHDFGKIIAGDGHAQIGADLAKQVFPDLTDAQYKAIAEHMGTPKTSLGKATKAADIDNGRSVGSSLKYSRDPVYIEGYTMEYPLFVKELGARYKKGKARIEDYNESEGIKFPIGFTPMFKMWPGRVLRAHGRETIRRMEPYIDVDKTMGELPIVGKGSIREIITKNSEIPSYMGYYDKPGTLGAYNTRTGVTLIDPSRANKTVTAMQHERNMHGTERLLTPEMWKPYEELLEGNFNNNVYAEALPNGKIHYMTYDKNNVRIPISKDALRKEELRTTLGEYRKLLYDGNAYYAAEMDGALPVREDLETLRPYFETLVDNLTLPKVREDLSSINSYGKAYAATSHNNPRFLDLVKDILKYSPVIIPFIYPWLTDKKKKGGKLCLIPRK